MAIVVSLPICSLLPQLNSSPVVCSCLRISIVALLHAILAVLSVLVVSYILLANFRIWGSNHHYASIAHHDLSSCLLLSVLRFLPNNHRTKTPKNKNYLRVSTRYIYIYQYFQLYFVIFLQICMASSNV